jgi:pantothenate kinase type III
VKQTMIGFNLEAGIDYWLTGSFGIAARAGYRIVKGKVTVDLGPAYNDQMVDENVDYSGIYIGAGVMIALQQERKKPASINGW